MLSDDFNISASEHMTAAIDIKNVYSHLNGADVENTITIDYNGRYSTLSELLTKTNINLKYL